MILFKGLFESKGLSIEFFTASSDVPLK